jgi:hypothetical protein
VGIHSDPDASGDFRRALREALDAALELQDEAAVACPHPACGEVAVVTAPEEGSEVTAARSSVGVEEYEQVCCSAGHDVFVHSRTTK